MTTYRTRDGDTYERYEKFTIKYIATLNWIPLLVGENRVRYFESSQLVEIPDPRLTGLVYSCELPPRAIVLWKPVVTLTPELAAHVNHAIGVEVRVAA